VKLCEEDYYGDNGDSERKPSRSHEEGEEPRRKERSSKRRSRSRERERRRSGSREKRRSRSRERRRSRSAERGERRRKSRSRERGERRRSRSRDRGQYDRRDDRRGGGGEREPYRRSQDRGGGQDRNRRDRSRDRRVEARLGSPPGARRSAARGPISPPRGQNSEFHIRNVRDSPDLPLTPEERDARTVFCMQLSQRCRARDVEEFFSSVGKVRDVKLIVCNKTRRFKGIAYVEFKDMESVPLAMGLSGQKLLGVPIIVQPSQAEKNRAGNYFDPMTKPDKGPMRLYVGSLHFNITEEMLKGIFEPFGRIHSIQLMKDPETDRSKGYGFITYNEAEDAKKALEHLNGFELAGRPMKVRNEVGHVTDRNDMVQGFLDQDDDRAGFDLGATGRLALMAKLAEGTGMKIPDAATNALNMNGTTVMHPNPPPEGAPPIATQCFMLSNMFDPARETMHNWDSEIRDDVIDECNKHGGVTHIYVDKASPQGNVYVKCPNITTAVAAVNALHGRWFAGKVITAAYVPVVNYNNLFPDASNPTGLQSTRR